MRKLLNFSGEVNEDHLRDANGMDKVCLYFLRIRWQNLGQ